MTAISIKPELSLNTIAAVVAVAGVIYLGYRLKNGVSETIDSVGNWWDGVDLNPFDKDGTITKLITTAKEPETLQEAARKAMAAKGRDINQYRFYYPAIEGKKLPAGAWTVKYNGQTHYLVPRMTQGFGVFTL